MSLKPKNSQPPDSPSGKTASLTGPWGRISSANASFDVVRFCQGFTPGSQRSHSYPYRVISSWHWRRRLSEEELLVEAAGDLVTIRGRRLDRVVEALDRGTLEILREIAGETPAAQEDSIWITSISVEGKQAEME